MSKIADLVDFLKDDNKTIPEKYWSEDVWKRELDLHVPGWKDLVLDSKNWPILEYCRVAPEDSTNYLNELFLNTTGLPILLNKGSKCRYLTWVREIQTSLQPDAWAALTINMRAFLIDLVFDEFPGPPYVDHELLEHITGGYNCKWGLEPVTLMIPPLTEYIPSRQVNHLQRISRAAKDTTSLNMICMKIDERRAACHPLRDQWRSPRIPYIPNPNDRELIARLFDHTRNAGYDYSALPEIYISSETPPIFISYPDLEDRGFDGNLDDFKNRRAADRPRHQHNKKSDNEISNDSPDRENDEIPPSSNRGAPEVISIETLLGCYIPNPKIIIYDRGFYWFVAREKARYPKTKLNISILRSVVLLHEIAHWITHRLKKPGVPSWPLELYQLTEKEVHEGWAQLMSWWVLERVKGIYFETFEKLESSSPQEYHVFKEFLPSVNSRYTEEYMMSSLEKLRMLSWPARLDDWKRIIHP